METSSWRHFENRIKSNIEARGHFVSRIPTGCQIIGRPGPSPKVQLIRTDFDFCASINGRAIFFDAKADSAKNFNFKSYVTRPKKMHQFRAMLDANLRGGAVAGYLIWFYTLNQITWAPVQVVHGMIREGACSLNPDTPGVRSQEDWRVIELETLALGPNVSPNVAEQSSERTPTEPNQGQVLDRLVDDGFDDDDVSPF